MSRRLGLMVASLLSLSLAPACGGKIAPDDRPDGALPDPVVPAPEPPDSGEPPPTVTPEPVPDVGPPPELPDTRLPDTSVAPLSACLARPEVCGHATTRQAWAQSVVDGCLVSVGHECGSVVFHFDDPEGCPSDTLDVVGYSGAFTACLRRHADGDRCSGDVAVPSSVGAKAVPAHSCS